MIYLQRYGSPPKLQKEEQSLYLHAILENIPVSFFTAGNIDLSLVRECDLLSGSIESYLSALSLLGIDEVKPNYYPSCLGKFLGRNVWQGTVKDVLSYITMGKEVFAKPYDSWKTFSGQVFGPSCNNYPIYAFETTNKLWLSDVISLKSEFRCYVLDSELLACCQYIGEDDDEPDYDVVEEAISLLAKQSNMAKSYSLDFGNTESNTVLVEAGDGFSVGRYKGISEKDYYAFLKARWVELTK